MSMGKKLKRRFLGAFVLALLTASGVAALSGPQCLEVSRSGSVSEIQEMLSVHTVEELYRVRDSGGVGLLHYTLRRGEAFWRPLLEAGWPLARESGWTPLHEACLQGNLEALKALLSMGAPLETKEPLNGGTSLHVACFNGHLELVKLLVAKGANVNARDREGWTPLSQARDQGFPQIVDWLKKHGATR